MLVYAKKYRTEDKLKIPTIQILNTTQTKQTMQTTAKQNYPGSHSARYKGGLILQCSWAHMGNCTTLIISVRILGRNVLTITERVSILTWKLTMLRILLRNHLSILVSWYSSSSL